MVNTSKLKLTLLQQDILRLFYKKAGLSLNQNQISKHLKVSAPAVKKALPYLEDNDLILVKKDKETKRLSIQLNLDNHFVLGLKRADNLKQFYESGLADYLEVALAGSTIILFGSYSRGEDIFNSDIDIAVIERKEKKIELDKYEKYLERKIHILFFDSFRKINEHLRNNIMNGYTITGSVVL
jgi:predicted nucleotidyltransferase